MSTKNNYTTILFDAGDTLTYQMPLRVPLIGKQLSDFFSYRVYPALYLARQDGGDARVNAPRPRHWRILLAALRWWMRPFPESAEVLAELRARGWRLAVLSNAPWWGAEILRQTGLADYFADIIISAEVEWEKPDRAIYEYALKRLGAAAEEVIFVDDSLPNVCVARELGMCGVRMARFEQHDPAAGADVRDLWELLWLIDALENADSTRLHQVLL